MAVAEAPAALVAVAEASAAIVSIAEAIAAAISAIAPVSSVSAVSVAAACGPLVAAVVLAQGALSNGLVGGKGGEHRASR